MTSLVEASYSITVPPGCAPPTTTASSSSPSTSSTATQPVPAQQRITAPLKLSLSHTPGVPHSSRETESEFLGALADSIDELKAKLMVDMSAWKDSVGEFEDKEAKRMGQDGGGEKKGKGGASGEVGGGEMDEEDEDEEDDDEEDEE